MFARDRGAARQGGGAEQGGGAAAGDYSQHSEAIGGLVGGGCAPAGCVMSMAC